MAKETNAYDSYTAVGVREDLSDMVTNISPNDTLFYNAIGTSSNKVKNTKHEFLTDALAAAAENAQLEGDARTASAITAATRIYNMHQIQSKTFRITDTTLELTAAGDVTSEDYQTAKHTKELAGDMEYAFLRGVRNDGAVATARQMRGALNWVTTNLDKASDATLNADGTVSGGTARPLTKQIFNDVCQNVFSSGGKPGTVYCGPFQKRQITSWMQNDPFRTAVESKKLVDVVDVYINDFFSMTIKAHRAMPTDVVLICDHDYWSKATLRPASKRKLAKTGDSEPFDITCEHTLEANAEAANGRITNLTTTI